MDSIRIWRAARRLYRAELVLAKAQDSAAVARSVLIEAASQTDSGRLAVGAYSVLVRSDGQVAVTLVPMLRGDQLELPLKG